MGVFMKQIKNYDHLYVWIQIHAFSDGKVKLCSRNAVSIMFQRFHQEQISYQQQFVYKDMEP